MCFQRLWLPDRSLLLILADQPQVLDDYSNSYQNNLIIALLHYFQRDVPSAELVMINRIFLADEKLALMKEKKMVLEGMLQLQKVIFK